MKLAANWIMSDIAAYLKNEKLSINDIKLTPQELAELIAAIKDGTISGKIGKEVSSVQFNLKMYDLFFESVQFIPFFQILFELLAKGGTVKGMIKAKDLVQASPCFSTKCAIKELNPENYIFHFPTGLFSNR